MTNTTRALIGTVMAVMLGIGCGGDESDGSNFDTGVDDNKTLSSVSQSEADKICAATADWSKSTFSAEKLKEFSCRLSGVIAGAFAGGGSQAQMACKSAYDQCVKQPASNTGTSTMTTCQKPAANCNATVGELEACMKDLVGAWDSVVAAFPTCDKLSSSTTTMPMQVQTPASCQTLEMKCPGMTPTTPNLTGTGA